MYQVIDRLGLSLFLGLLCLTTSCHGDKILMLPYGATHTSRAMNMEKLALMLTEHGHNVTMIVRADYTPWRPLPGVVLETYNVTVNDGSQLPRKLDFKTMMRLVKSDIFTLIHIESESNRETCKHMLSDKQLMSKIKRGTFSLFIFDYLELCSAILLYQLKLPSVMYSNYGLTGLWIANQNPLNPATTLMEGADFTNNMNYIERFRNTMLWIAANAFYNYYYIRDIENLLSTFLPDYNFPPIHRCFENVSIIIAANTHFALDFPRPVMPHIKPISGLQWTPPRPLSSDLLSFMSSAHHGVILMSFGSMMPTLEEETAELFAKVFSKLPQKVLWRYKGPVPPSLGENTKIMEWIPQNDILAHPAMKLFITHCGISSTWETLFHAVPVVAVPLFADQHHNAAKLVKRAKIGVLIDFHTMTQIELKEAINVVLINEKYKQNAAKMSEILQDVPISAKDEFLFWVDYVIRHRGPLFLHNKAVYRLSWHQYYLLDIILPLVAAFLCLIYLLKVFVVFIFKMIKRVSKLLIRREKMKKT
ncbi:UDP-glucuronosyltransferase 2C1 isoform X1 [Lingula anatina]|uniref:UDP-glucuronosyltransferase n=1 Tax=Lingula anatina TaxID=7574 RepID=A0A2R2MRU6_LINAN|nr:UDP-glucuronosyltransferase 2C1 isoform X1 [Lingula anatina]|eukprot:XP_023932980.1 UDP-glucuronosyltransferase 2C1 isoform X1 [Lingula anatina]